MSLWYDEVKEGSEKEFMEIQTV